jgi:hypothetical protein
MLPGAGSVVARSGELIRYRSNVAPQTSPAASPAADNADAIEPPKDAEVNDDRRPMTASERKKLTRERRRQGVRYMVTIAIYDHALDAFVENGDMSEEEVNDRRKAAKAIEDIVNWQTRRNN